MSERRQRSSKRVTRHDQQFLSVSEQMGCGGPPYFYQLFNFLTGLRNNKTNTQFHTTTKLVAKCSMERRTYLIGS